jgi:hypothetical protein
VNPILVLAHALSNCDVFPLIPFFKKIIVTGSQSNIKSVESLLRYVRFDKQERNKYLDAFQKNEDPFKHFCLDFQSRTVTQLCDRNGENMNTLVDISAGNDRSLAVTLIGQLDNPGKANAVFSLIFKHIEKRVNKDDFTLVLKSAKTRKKQKISVIEYLDAITTEGRPVDPVLLHFHKYVSNFVHIPSCFLLNKLFLR